LFSCWHCVDITVKKLRAICDLSGAVAHLFLFGTPIGSWRFSFFDFHGKRHRGNHGFFDDPSREAAVTCPVNHFWD
jgi:hypothetical protein